MSAENRKYQIDLSARIIPARSAGGFELGISINEIDEEVLSQFQIEKRLNPLKLNKLFIKFISKDLVLYVDDNIITQIGAVGDYPGKMQSGLGLGNFVHEFEKVYGRIDEGDEDELIFLNLYGLCFEPDYINFDSSEEWKISIPKLRMKEIYIHNQPVYK